MTNEEYITSFEIMNASIEKALETGDVNDLYDFHMQSEMVMRELESFKGHLHLPEHLEYLRDQFKHRPQYQYHGVYRNVIGYERINYNF